MKDGQNDVVGCAGSNLYSALPADLLPENVELRCIKESLSAPIKKGQRIGTVEVWYEDKCVGQCDLLAMYDVNEPGLYDHTLLPTAEETVKRTWITVLLIGGIALAAVVVVFVLVLFIRRWIVIRQLRRRRKLIEEG